MPIIHRTLIFTISSCWALIGCVGYGVTVNQQPVYSPRPLLAIDDIADPNLAACLEQHAADRQIVRAEQLTVLVCTHAGIEGLRGLEQFSKLKQLDLSHNALNRVKALFKLAELEYLKLEGNPELSCADIKTLAALPKDKRHIVAPEHCDERPTVQPGR